MTNFSHTITCSHTVCLGLGFAEVRLVLPLNNTKDDKSTQASVRILYNNDMELNRNQWKGRKKIYNTATWFWIGNINHICSLTYKHFSPLSTANMPNTSTET